MCWWHTHGPHTPSTTTQATGTIHQYMNHISNPPNQLVQPPHPYLSHRNGRRTATIRAHGPTPCVLPSADPYSPPTTSDLVLSQIQGVAPPAPPFITIPGTPDPESPISTTPKRQTDHATFVRRQYLTMIMCRRNRQRRHSQRLKHTKKTIRQPAPQISPVSSPLSTPEQSDSDTHNYPNNDSDTSLDIHYRANSNHRPEMGESNAESALRQENIEHDVTRMKKERE